MSIVAKTTIEIVCTSQNFITVVRDCLGRVKFFIQFSCGTNENRWKRFLSETVSHAKEFQKAKCSGKELLGSKFDLKKSNEVKRSFSDFIFTSKEQMGVLL